MIDKLNALEKKFDELKGPTSDAWETTKAAFASAWGELEKGYDSVKAKFDQNQSGGS